MLSAQQVVNLEKKQWRNWPVWSAYYGPDTVPDNFTSALMAGRDEVKLNFGSLVSDT